ncbi:neural/ectodermal development factor IMP-L2 [Plutella xylostella]|uniref:neural/ectodermal development factor IMP-L2 n=1 Tax=Plutella xylostella TaxID=51655 RepID=UPI0020328775|nr:neural/ectodermal development factor IMP-L2 [Plutella xylostella]
MISLMSLLVAATLVSLQHSFTNAQIDNSKMDIDNSLQANVLTPPTRRSRFHKFLSISEPPPATATWSPDTPVELSCGFMGKPAPIVSWLKNGEPITEYEEETNDLIAEEPSSIASGTSTLIISSSTGHAEDVYTCVVTSGTTQKTASTTVYSTPANEADELLSLQKLFNVPTRPRIVMSYVDMFQVLGSNVVLPCQVYTFEKSQIYWQDNQEHLVYGNSRVRVLPSGSLLINNLRWSDMGMYTCTVKNMLGKDSASTFVYPMKTKAH